MAEDSILDDASATGLSTDDIKPHIYEGGFKTWECAVDLAKYLATKSDYLSRMLTCPFTIVEVGLVHHPVVVNSVCCIGLTVRISSVQALPCLHN